MTWDSRDRRSVEIPQERVDRMIGTVLARLDESRHPVAARPDLAAHLRAWLAGLMPASRFAMPMAAAALLGVVVGRHLQTTEAALQFADLLSYTSIYASGF